MQKNRRRKSHAWAPLRVSITPDTAPTPIPYLAIVSTPSSEDKHLPSASRGL
jgi:hypothetical protein